MLDPDGIWRVSGYFIGDEADLRIRRVEFRHQRRSQGQRGNWGASLPGSASFNLWGRRLGLMGALATGTIAAQGHVIGVIRRALVDKEMAHNGYRNWRVVTSMHERKAMMADLAAGFIALPGGWGTERFFEVLTWGSWDSIGRPADCSTCRAISTDCCRSLAFH